MQRCVALKIVVGNRPVPKSPLEISAAQLCFVTEIAAPEAATAVVVCEQKPYPV